MPSGPLRSSSPPECGLDEQPDCQRHVSAISPYASPVDGSAGVDRSPERRVFTSSLALDVDKTMDEHDDEIYWKKFNNGDECVDGRLDGVDFDLSEHDNQHQEPDHDDGGEDRMRVHVHHRPRSPDFRRRRQGSPPSPPREQWSHNERSPRRRLPSAEYHHRYHRRQQSPAHKYHHDHRAPRRRHIVGHDASSSPPSASRADRRSHHGDEPRFHQRSLHRHRRSPPHGNTSPLPAVSFDGRRRRRSRSGDSFDGRRVRRGFFAGRHTRSPASRSPPTRRRMRRDRSWSGSASPERLRRRLRRLPSAGRTFSPDRHSRHEAPSPIDLRFADSLMTAAAPPVTSQPVPPLSHTLTSLPNMPPPQSPHVLPPPVPPPFPPSPMPHPMAPPMPPPMVPPMAPPMAPGVPAPHMMQPPGLEFGGGGPSLPPPPPPPALSLVPPGMPPLGVFVSDAGCGGVLTSTVMAPPPPRPALCPGGSGGGITVPPPAPPPHTSLPPPPLSPRTPSSTTAPTAWSSRRSSSSAAAASDSRRCVDLDEDAICDADAHDLTCTVWRSNYQPDKTALTANDLKKLSVVRKNRPWMNERLFLLRMQLDEYHEIHGGGTRVYTDALDTWRRMVADAKMALGISLTDDTEPGDGGGGSERTRHMAQILVHQLLKTRRLADRKQCQLLARLQQLQFSCPSLHAGTGEKKVVGRTPNPAVNIKMQTALEGDLKMVSSNLTRLNRVIDSLATAAEMATMNDDHDEYAASTATDNGAVKRHTDAGQRPVVPEDMEQIEMLLEECADTSPAFTALEETEFLILGDNAVKILDSYVYADSVRTSFGTSVKPNKFYVLGDSHLSDPTDERCYTAALTAVRDCQPVTVVLVSSEHLLEQDAVSMADMAGHLATLAEHLRGEGVCRVAIIGPPERRTPLMAAVRRRQLHEALQSEAVAVGEGAGGVLVHEPIVHTDEEFGQPDSGTACKNLYRAVCQAVRRCLQLGVPPASAVSLVDKLSSVREAGSVTRAVLRANARRLASVQCRRLAAVAQVLDRLDCGDTRVDQLVSGLNVDAEDTDIYFRDPSDHVCVVCNLLFSNAKQFLKHISSESHIVKYKESCGGKLDSPWHKNIPVVAKKKVNARPVSIKGVDMFVRVECWYCRVCDVFVGDMRCASSHLKSRRHNTNYDEYVRVNPEYGASVRETRLRLQRKICSDQLLAQRQRLRGEMEARANQLNERIRARAAAGSSTSTTTADAEQEISDELAAPAAMPVLSSTAAEQDVTSKQQQERAVEQHLRVEVDKAAAAAAELAANCRAADGAAKKASIQLNLLGQAAAGEQRASSPPPLKLAKLPAKKAQSSASSGRVVVGKQRARHAKKPAAATDTATADDDDEVQVLVEPDDGEAAARARSRGAIKKTPLIGKQPRLRRRGRGCTATTSDTSTAQHPAGDGVKSSVKLTDVERATLELARRQLEEEVGSEEDEVQVLDSCEEAGSGVSSGGSKQSTAAAGDGAVLHTSDCSDGDDDLSVLGICREDVAAGMMRATRPPVV